MSSFLVTWATTTWPFSYRSVRSRQIFVQDCCSEFAEEQQAEEIRQKSEFAEPTDEDFESSSSLVQEELQGTEVMAHGPTAESARRAVAAVEEEML